MQFTMASTRHDFEVGSDSAATTSHEVAEFA
jgi:hypothetical protein